MRRSSSRLLGAVALVVVVFATCVAGSYLLSLRSANDVVVNALDLRCANGDATFEAVPFLADADVLGDDEDGSLDKATKPGFRLDLSDDEDMRCVLTLGARNEGSRAVTLAAVEASTWARGERSGWPLQADEGSVGVRAPSTFETSADSTSARFVLDAVIDADSSTTVQIPFVQRPGACLGAGDVASTVLSARVESWWWTTRRTTDVTVAVTSQEGLGTC